jgi:hypothetical protein
MNRYALCDHSYRQTFSEADRLALMFLGAVTGTDGAIFHHSPFNCPVLKAINSKKIYGVSKEYGFVTCGYLGLSRTGPQIQ